MKYIFTCTSCNEDIEIDMPISKYSSEGHLCHVCGKELIRKPEDFCSLFSNKSGGFYNNINVG